MTTRAQGHETRARLVRAATEFFAERGIHDTSLNAVAAAAGVTRQGLLHYFPSKTELVLAVLEQRDEDDRARIPPEVAKAGDLAGVLLAIMQSNQEEQGLTQFFAIATAEGARPGDPTHEYFQERYARRRGEMAYGIARLQEHGRIKHDLDPELLSSALLALLFGLNLQQMLDPELDHAAALAAMMRQITLE